MTSEFKKQVTKRLITKLAKLKKHHVNEAETCRRLKAAGYYENIKHGTAAARANECNLKFHVEQVQVLDETMHNLKVNK